MVLPDLVVLSIIRKSLNGLGRAERTWRLFQLSQVCRQWERIITTDEKFFKSTLIRLYQPLSRLDIDDSDDGFIPDQARISTLVQLKTQHLYLLNKTPLEILSS